jgi:hypothetical protein
MGKKDKKPLTDEDDIGFEAISDEDLGFEPQLSPEQKAKMAAYVSQPEDMGMIESGLVGAGQGLTLNHAPQLGAAMGAGLEKLAGMEMEPEGFPLVPGVESSKDKKLQDLYNEYLKFNKQRDVQAQHANPISYTTGNIAGGVLGFGAGSKMAAPAVEAVASRMPPLVAATGQVMNKIYPSAVPMGIMGGIMAEGSGEHPIMSPEGAEEIATGVGMGIGMGTLAPPAISALAKGAQKTASGVKTGAGIIGESLFGLSPDAWKRGLQGEMLVGKKAAQKTGDEMMQFGLEVPQQLAQEAQKLAQTKLSILRIAEENGVRIDASDIDDFMNSHLKSSSPSSLVEVQREMQQIHELLRTAKNGPEVKKITRQYFGEGNTEKGDFANLFTQKQAEEKALQAQQPAPPMTQKEQFEQEFNQRKAEQLAVPGKNPNELELTYEPIEGTNNVLGIIRQKSNGEEASRTYRKVASRVIDPKDQKQMKAVNQLLAQKQAEQQAIPGSNEKPFELHLEPIEAMPDKQLAVIRQAQEDVGTQDYYTTVAKKVIRPDAVVVARPKIEMLLQPTDVPGKSLGIIRQAVIDEQGNITGYKKLASKLLSEEEAASWKDLSETVRAGGKDLTRPEELYQLYKDLKAKSEYGDYSYKTPEAKAVTSQAIEDVKTMLRSYMDELEPTDRRIEAINKAQEIIGSSDRDPRSVMKTFAALLGRTDSTSISSAGARSDLAHLIEQVKIANPELGHKLEAKAYDLANKFAVTGAVQKEIYLPRPTATLKAYVAKGANVLGYGIGQVTPEWMLNTAGQLIKRGGQAQQMLSNVLKNAAEKDDQTRTAIMFGLMQQPAYRAMLKEFIPQAQPQEKPR